MTLNASAKAYYQTKTPQDISFNTFISTIEINETGIDRICLQYNSSLGTDNIFYDVILADKDVEKI